MGGGGKRKRVLGESPLIYLDMLLKLYYIAIIVLGINW